MVSQDDHSSALESQTPMYEDGNHAGAVAENTVPSLAGSSGPEIDVKDQQISISGCDPTNICGRVLMTTWILQLVA
jgi:hypothetical protein